MVPLTIFILCHNRPSYAKQAIESVLRLTEASYTLVVSDNSSNEEVERMVTAEFPQVTYRRRMPMLPPLAHFNRCVEEADTDYFCLFHDDDLLLPEFAKTMMQCAREHPEAIAIGCNAYIERFGKLETRTSFRSFRKREILTSMRDLAARYFSRAQSGFPPFPGYIYNRSMVNSQRFPPEGGKYVDVTWLLGLIRKGLVVWITQPLMIYRTHGGNDGLTESPRDRLRLLGFLKQNSGCLGKDILQDYRYAFLYRKIAQDMRAGHSLRRRVAIAFIKHFRRARYFRLDYYRALAVRAWVKWKVE